MFPNVSGSKGSKELPATRNLASVMRLGGNTLLTPPVADVDIFSLFCDLLTSQKVHQHCKVLCQQHSFEMYLQPS